MAKSLFVLEKIVRAIPEPKFTDTWHPVSHDRVISALETAVGQLNWKITRREYMMTKEGKNMFGTWAVQRVNVKDDPSCEWLIGFRNSISKNFAIGVCAGLRITVCSNMVFSGEFVEFRKHTSGVDNDELQRLANKAILSVDLKITGLHEWLIGLKEYPVSDNLLKGIVYDAMDSGVVPPSKFKEFLKSIHEEYTLANSGMTLHTLHSAVTRLMRGKSFFYVAQKNEKLIALINEYTKKITITDK